MRISDFDYDLPEERIAQKPPKQRGASRLLVLHKDSGRLEHRHYGDLADYLHSGDVLVLNDTKVIKARLLARTADGKTRELLLLEEHGRGEHTTVLYRGKLHEGETLRTGRTPITVAKVLDGGLAEIKSPVDPYELAEQYGSVPLPPYMKRQATKADIERYQTVFAQKAGSVAAPTASLNFTKELEQRLQAKGVILTYLTLHVGLGTFLPIRSDEVEAHTMHSEYFEIPKQTAAAIRRAKQQGRKITALGTTVTRTLEYATTSILNDSHKTLSGEADIFIYPGYKFQIVDRLLTNFHAPRSTVLMLAAAFASWDNLRQAYEEAVKQEYTFLSYGDSMFIV